MSKVETITIYIAKIPHPPFCTMPPHRNWDIPQANARCAREQKIRQSRASRNTTQHRRLFKKLTHTHTHIPTSQLALRRPQSKMRESAGFLGIVNAFGDAEYTRRGGYYVRCSRELRDEVSTFYARNFSRPPTRVPIMPSSFTPFLISRAAHACDPRVSSHTHISHTPLKSSTPSTTSDGRCGVGGGSTHGVDVVGLVGRRCLIVIN